MEVAPRHEMVAFLDSLGTADVDHTGGDFLQHLCGVHDLLLARGASARVAAAGMFHSIYGTETFQGFSLPLDQRPRVQELIGERAEHLAWCNCVMDRASFDASLGDALAGAEQLEIRDRDGSPISLSLDELRELAEVQLFDWLEQVERIVSDDPSADVPRTAVRLGLPPTRLPTDGRAGWAAWTLALRGRLLPRARRSAGLRRSPRLRPLPQYPRQTREESAQ